MRSTGTRTTDKESTMDLSYWVRQLAEARRDETESKAKLAEMQAEIDALIQERYGNLLSAQREWLSTSQGRAIECEEKIRELATQSYADTGDKHPHDAVTVKVYTRLDYDPEQAFRYCVDHLTTALKMDTRKFETVAKAAELDFVDFVDEPRATISRDLSAYLAE